MRSLVVLGALALLVAGCTATPYQPMTLNGGYTQTRLGSDMFNVVFQGNAYTPRKTAEDYALYRSAELSLESGFDYFVVVGGNADVSLRPLAVRGADPPSATSADSHPIVSLVVRGYSQEPPPAQAFNARDVLKMLGPTIKRK